MIELRQYQLDAVQRIRDEIRRGKRAILLAAPTGSGKTVIGAHILHSANQRDRKNLFIAHRRELIHQASNKLKAFGLDHGIMMSDEPMSALAETQVASIQTFVSRVVKRNRISAPSADVVMVDECHHATANSYLHLKEIYPDAIFIGLTATPCRTDGRGLGKFFDCLIEVATPQELIDLGYLVDTKIVAPRLPDLRGLRTVRGDYEEAELAKRMTPMIGDLVDDWKHFASTRSTLVFAVTVAHSVWIKERFENAGITCEHVDAQTPMEKRDRIFDDFHEGKIQVLTNVGIATEGTDLPIASCAILARPTKSYGLYLQMTGRICRPHAGKKDALIIDHSGAVYAHGFPQDAGGWELDEKFSMTEKNQQRLAKETNPITCRECFSIYTKQLHCPNCGALPNKKGQSLSMEEGRLYHVPRQKKQKVETFTVEQKANWYGQLKALELATSKKHGWAAHKYREKFSVWPNLPEIRDAPHITPTPEVKSFVQAMNIRYAKSRER